MLGPYLAAAISVVSQLQPTQSVRTKVKSPKTKTIRSRRAKNKQAKNARKRGRK